MNLVVGIIAALALIQSVESTDQPLPSPATSGEECPSPPPGDVVAFRGPIAVTVRTERGEFEFSTEIAYSPAQRSRGMMFRETLSPDQAMLFVDDVDQEQSFFMRNTCVALDLVWVTGDLRVVGVHENAAPFDETSVLSPEPVRYVFEIPGGRAAEIGLKAGDVLVFGSAG